MYSQQDEEKYILEALKGITGTFLDIGAWHPTDKSNTRRLIELGWSGVLIEPSPGPFINLMRACVKCGHTPVYEQYGQHTAERCLRMDPVCPGETCGGERYGFCDRLTLVLAAAGRPGAKAITLHASDDALTTQSVEHRDNWKLNGGASFYGSFVTPIFTWADIVRLGKNFDFVSIDTEGSSFDLFQSMLYGVRPKCVCVEHDGLQAEILGLTDRYTVAHENNTNLILVHK